MSRHGIIWKGRRGGSIPALLGLYEFTCKMDEGPESYVNRRSKRGSDNPGGGVESIFLLERRIERRIHLRNLKSSFQMLAQTSHPPTRNLFGKTHDADGGGTTDNGTDDGAHDTSDDVNERRRWRLA